MGGLREGWFMIVMIDTWGVMVVGVEACVKTFFAHIENQQ